MTTTKHDRYMVKQYPYEAMDEREPEGFNHFLNRTANKGWTLVRVVGNRAGLSRSFIATTIWERTKAQEQDL